MLLDQNQPLFLKWGYLPKLAPWLVRYLGHANAADTARIAAALAPIVRDSLAEHQALAEGTSAAKTLKAIHGTSTFLMKAMVSSGRMHQILS